MWRSTTGRSGSGTASAGFGRGSGTALLKAACRLDRGSGTGPASGSEGSSSAGSAAAMTGDATGDVTGAAAGDRSCAGSAKAGEALALENDGGAADSVANIGSAG